MPVLQLLKPGALVLGSLQRLLKLVYLLEGLLYFGGFGYPGVFLLSPEIADVELLLLQLLLQPVHNLF